MNDVKFSYDEVNFHKTFAPQNSYISRIMELAADGFTGTKEEISEKTGIPTGKTSGKVVPHILYAKYMGLTTHTLENGKYTLSLTPLGKILLNKDHYFFEDMSRLICHYNMTDFRNGALLWAYLYEGLPLMVGETISDDMLKRRYSEFFNVKVDLRPLERAYEDGFFSSLGLLDLSDGLRLNAMYCRDELLYVYAYTLLRSWEQRYPNTMEITADQIELEMKWSKRFGFDTDETLIALEQMENAQMIRMNKQLIPVTVIRTAKSEEILPRLYDLLN